MPVNDERPDPIASRDQMKQHLETLEAYVKRTTAAGEPVPPEITDMVKLLRQLVFALDGLTANFEEN